MYRITLTLRGLVEGEAEGPALVLTKPLSFYGEVDPETGRLMGREEGETLRDKILLAPSTRGSTVGPFILYALAYHNAAPKAIVVAKAEPLLVAGAVMAETPLAEGIPEELLGQLRQMKECRARLRVNPPSARLEIECSTEET